MFTYLDRATADHQPLVFLYYYEVTKLAAN